MDSEAVARVAGKIAWIMCCTAPLPKFRTIDRDGKHEGAKVTVDHGHFWKIGRF